MPNIIYSDLVRNAIAVCYGWILSQWTSSQMIGLAGKLDLHFV